jgi:hypothetical protein
MVKKGQMFYSFASGTIRLNLSFRVASASFSIRLTSTSHVGISWIKPMTWPVVQT